MAGGLRHGKVRCRPILRRGARHTLLQLTAAGLLSSACRSVATGASTARTTSLRRREARRARLERRAAAAVLTTAVSRAGPAPVQ